MTTSLKTLWRFPSWAGRYLLVITLYWLSGLVVGGGLILLYVVDGMPDLDLWHEIELEHEYSVDEYPDVKTLADYIALEQALFAEQDVEVYGQVTPEAVAGFSRYQRGSLVDPTSYHLNWNRTQELLVQKPRAGVLLLHGLSDSPYSLRQLALDFHAQNVSVVLPRLPGHGTVPAALAEVSAEDFKAVVRLAARALRQQIGGDAPIYIVGYSTGATLALEYVMAQLLGESLEHIEGLVLISPAIGVTPLAALAPWQRRLANLPGLGELSWQSVLPEFDPYKYNSFPLNAAEQVYGLTQELVAKTNQLLAAGKLDQLPPVLAFTSAVDATVSVVALMDNLMAKLQGTGHHLVVYDVNQDANTAFLFAPAVRQWCQQLLAGSYPFALDVLTNEPTDSRKIARLHKPAGEAEATSHSTTLEWPAQLYSLSHVALPFPDDDPAYGDIPSEHGKPASLGNVVLRGERGVLQVPVPQLMRLRYNPFFAYQQEQIMEFVLSNAHFPD